MVAFIQESKIGQNLTSENINGSKIYATPIPTLPYNGSTNAWWSHKASVTTCLPQYLQEYNGKE